MKTILLLMFVALPCLGGDYRRIINGKIYDFTPHYAWLKERRAISCYNGGNGKLAADYKRRKITNDSQWHMYSWFLVEGNPAGTRPEGMIVSRRIRPPGSKWDQYSDVLLKNAPPYLEMPIFAVPVGPTRVGSVAIETFDCGKPVSSPMNQKILQKQTKATK
jgi:hypothetical protein